MCGRISFMKIACKKFIKKHYFYEYNMYIHISIVVVYIVLESRKEKNLPTFRIHDIADGP